MKDLRHLVSYLLLASAWIGCTAQNTGDGHAAPDAAGVPSAEAGPGRAAEAGLTDAQDRQLAGLGVPVAVPVLPDGWALADSDAGVDAYEGLRFPRYTLRYRHEDGACFSIEAASGGLGGVFADEPPHLEEVAVPGLATYGPAFLGWGEEGEDDAWNGRMQTEWFGADGLAFSLASASDDGCRMLAPDDAAALLGTLRYLDPADDALALGPMLWIDLSDPPIGEMGNGPTPEATAAQAFAMTEGEGRSATATETLRRRDAHAVVLVTNTNLPDDSVQDERIRVVLVPGDEGWLVAEAGRQVRCREGRGHTDWGGVNCL